MSLLLAIAAAMVVNTSASWCSPAQPVAEFKGPQSAAFFVKPDLQAQAIERLAWTGLVILTAEEAARLAGKSTQPGLNYYLARAAYRGGDGKLGMALPAVNLALDVDTEGRGFITTTTLTRAITATNIPVVLESKAAISHVYTRCMSAS